MLVKLREWLAADPDDVFFQYRDANEKIVTKERYQSARYYSQEEDFEIDEYNKNIIEEVFYEHKRKVI